MFRHLTNIMKNIFRETPDISQQQVFLNNKICCKGFDVNASGVMTQDDFKREPVKYELDISYASNENPRQRLDLFLPDLDRTDKLPVIVFFHGGAWLEGDKSDGAARLMHFLRTGEYAGISAGYRLTDEATWPAQFYDCKAVIRWVRANAGKYGLDPDRIAVWGHSAGGHLALMLGVTGDIPEMEGDVGPFHEVTSKISVVVNFFGVTDMMGLLDKPSLCDSSSLYSPEVQLIGGPLPENPELTKAASPITYVRPNIPPVMTLHGTEDLVVPYEQAVRFDKALCSAGVPSYFITVTGAGHGGFPAEVLERIAAFLNKYLLEQDVDISTEPLKAKEPD